MPAIRTPADLVSLVKAKRLALGESQSQFAARIRKTQAWVSDFERGATPNIYLGTLLEVLSLAGFILEATSDQACLSDRPVEDDDGDLAIDFPEAGSGLVP